MVVKSGVTGQEAISLAVGFAALITYKKFVSARVYGLVTMLLNQKMSLLMLSPIIPRMKTSRKQLRTSSNFRGGKEKWQEKRKRRTKAL